MSSNNNDSSWDANLAGLQNVIDDYEALQRKALKAAAEAVAPRLIDAAPVRVSEKQGGNSLPEYALKGSVRAKVEKGKDGKLLAVVDFGKCTHIAYFVDRGHQPPHAKLAKRLNRRASGQNTPAHPFIRSVQDSSRALAQTTYEESLTNSIKAALGGKK